MPDEQIAEVQGFKEKSIANLRASIEGSKDRPLWRLLVGLNIRHVGSTVAQLLARTFPSIDELREASAEQLNAIDGIGPEIAQSVYDWFHEKEKVRLLEKMAGAEVSIQDDNVGPPSQAPHDGRTY